MTIILSAVSLETRNYIMLGFVIAVLISLAGIHIYHTIIDSVKEKADDKEKSHQSYNKFNKK
jgi:hypothetical protein